MTLLVSEIFYSIQGESSWAGHPCLFIRLAGCNLRCSYCDARYTYDEEATAYRLDALLTTLDKLAPGSKKVELVEITGGEPLLQEGVYPLIDALLGQGRRVLLESNGSLALDRVPAEVHCIMDIKCPGSGMADHFRPENLERLTADDEIKFVISDRADYDWAKALLSLHRLAPPGPALIFSPVTSRLDPAKLAVWLLADALPARLQLQLHTQLWPSQTRGF